MYKTLSQTITNIHNWVSKKNWDVSRLCDKEEAREKVFYCRDVSAWLLSSRQYGKEKCLGEYYYEILFSL